MMIDFISATSADPADDMLPYAAFYLGLHRCLPKYLLIKINFKKKKSFRVSSSFDPDQARHFVRPNLAPNCLQRLSADNKKCPLARKELIQDTCL